MKFNQTKNTTTNFLYGIFVRMIEIACPFAVRTIILYKLGAEYAGLTGLFTSILQILNVSELGLSSAVSFCLYKPIAEDDRDTICALMNLLRRLYKIIGGFILAAGICMMPFLPHLIHGSYPADMNIYILYLMYLTNAAVSYLGCAYQGVLFEAMQEGAANYKISAIVNFIKYILQILALLVFANYYLYALFLPMSTLVITIMTGHKAKKQHPDLMPCGKVSKETKNTIKRKVAFLSAHSLAGAMINSIDNIVLSSLMGLFATAVYGNYFYIFSAVTNLMLVAYRAVKPAIGNKLYTGSHEEQRFLFRVVQYVSSWGTMWCAVCMLCLYQPFIKLWIGEKYLLDEVTMVMIVLYFYGNSIKLSLSGTYIDAAGLWEKTLLREIIVAVLNLVMDISLVKIFGIAGVVFASLFATVAVALPMDITVICRYAIKEKTIEGLGRILKNMILAVMIGIVCYGICRLLPFYGMKNFLLRGLVCMAMPNILMLLITGKSLEFDFLAKRILRR